MSNITFSAVIVSSSMQKVGERKLDIVRHATSGASLAALGATKGAVGKVARERSGRAGVVGIIESAANANYRPFAEYVAARTGEAVVISGRSTFEAQPDLMDAKVRVARTGKNGGMREDKKTGVMVPGAKLALALELHTFAVEVTRAVAEIHAAAKAERDAKAAQLESTQS